MKKYQSVGVVYGKLWGGGFGAYPAVKLQASTKEKLIETAKTMVENGSLDSGMGFEYLKGALLNIEEIETIEKNGKKYSRSEFESEVIGDLNEKEQNFLQEATLNYNL